MEEKRYGKGYEGDKERDESLIKSCIEQKGRINYFIICGMHAIKKKSENNQAIHSHI
jgi:hypothetical protein